MERVSETVPFRMASHVFLFFTLSDSNLVRNWFVCREPRAPVVKLICEAFQPLFSRLLRWLMKPKCELYLLFFSCSFFSAQSALVSIALVCSRNTHNFFSLSKARSPGLQEMKVSMSVSSKLMPLARCYSSMSFRSLALFCPAPGPGGRISCNPMYSMIL